jgi:hypothetical protein
MYSEMTKEDRQRAIDGGFIKGRKSSDTMPSKNRRYALDWIYCGKTETLTSNKTYGFCLALENKKKVEPQYKRGKFNLRRVI